MRLFMIISHVKIIAFQTIIIHCLWIFYIARKDCSLYNKQNNTCVLGNTRFISRVKHDISWVSAVNEWYITFNTRNKSGISVHPCIILYLMICLNYVIVVDGYALQWYYISWLQVDSCWIDRHRSFNAIINNNYLLLNIWDIFLLYLTTELT